MGVGIGLAFAAMANLIVEAVDRTKTSVATAMNTIMRTIGGSLGGQITASVVAGHVIAGTVEPGRVGLHDRLRDLGGRRRRGLLHGAVHPLAPALRGPAERGPGAGWRELELELGRGDAELDRAAVAHQAGDGLGADALGDHQPLEVGGRTHRRPVELVDHVADPDPRIVGGAARRPPRPPPPRARRRSRRAPAAAAAPGRRRSRGRRGARARRRSARR